jgi:predicted nucleic acid binding AN1-type Zn finger protein
MPQVVIIQLSIISGGILVACLMTVVAFRAWRGDKYLCDDCKYNDPESCKKVERPQAVDCASYVPKTEQAS